MRTGSVWSCACLLAAGAALAAAQTAAHVPSPAELRVCECGKNPPPPPRDREVAPYAGEPTDMSPYEKFAKPYWLNYTRPNIFSGAGRDVPDPKNLTEVRIGFFGPIEHTPDQVFGQRMLHGAQLAIEEANAHGGYGGIPYKLMLYNDYDNWQAKSVYGDDRPTDPTIWGSPSNEAVKMVYDDDDWAIFGSISSESTHIILRVSLKAEIPIVNSASTDPTIPETYIPWFFTDIQDDRVQCLTLARRIFTELGMKRVALLRVNNRYGRFGVLKFRDASRRLGHPLVIEQKFMPGDTDFSRELKIIQGSRADAIVIWGDEADAAGILKQMRALGMKQRVFGAYRTIGPELLAQAGAAAEGFEAVFPYDPTRNDPRWLAFNQRFEARFHEKPEQFAALAYDAMNALLDSICKAGLNRARIHDALANIEEYDGVTAHMTFDPNQKNVAPMYLATVHNGSISYRVQTMEKDEPPEAKPAVAPDQKSEAKPAAQPYARVGEDGVSFAGPSRPDAPEGPLRVVFFGPDAAKVAASEQVLKALAAASGTRAWKVIPIDSDPSWRGADWKVWAGSDALVRALWDEHAVAIVALNRDAAHLAEQLSLKAFVPVVALTDDTSITSTNVPWIFRMPGKTAPAEALAVLQSAEIAGGPNPEQMRDVLASGKVAAGVAFHANGEPQVN
ncbi:MAG: ABC transporter substrate-binding protein [Terracidiphilus sp.]|nr:ABC transporter substrate-binding protein [Terracidiphilus sp.]